MKNYLQEYFSFTKRERTGIIVLLALIGVTVALPYFLRVPSTAPDRAAFERLQQQLAQLETTKDSGYEAPYVPDHDLVTESRDEEVVLFAFDPNRLPVEGWKRLGIRARTAYIIQHYLAKGGRFRRPEDLYKIYGLRREEADRLLPYVKIEATEPVKEWPVAGRTTDSITHNNPTKRFREPAIIDINTADTTVFIALRGIGPKLAQRIVHFREKLGGFYAVRQVGETYGLPDSTFQQIRKLLHCPLPALRTININVTDATTLQQHPYIRWPLANAIVQYRQQHGVYESVDQLLKINTVTPAVLEKIRPYLAIE